MYVIVPFRYVLASDFAGDSGSQKSHFADFISNPRYIVLHKAYDYLTVNST